MYERVCVCVCVCADDCVCVQLLIEWGTDVHFKNKVSKTAMDLIRNADLEKSLRSKSNLFHYSS